MNATSGNGDNTTTRAIIVIVVIVLFLVGGVSAILIGRSAEQKKMQKQIYGIWDEQDVPSYARDIFEVRKEGIYIQDRLVDSHYLFDGKTLTYEYHNKEYVYQVKNANVTELERTAPLHYKSVFFLRGKHKNKS